MSERQKQEESLITGETHELRVAIFDLSSKALAGYDGQISLVQDMQPLNEDGLPGISHEARALRIGLRKNLVLPPLKVLGRLTARDQHPDAYAVSTTGPIDYDRVAKLQSFNLTHVEALVQETIKNPENPQMDPITAYLLESAFTLTSFIKALR